MEYNNLDISINTIKQEALSHLKENWIIAALSIIIIQIIAFTINMLPFVGLIALIFIFPPLYLGMSQLFLSFRRNQSGNLEMIFKGFNNFMPAVKLSVLKGLIFFLWALPSIITMILYLFFCFATLYTPDNNTMNVYKIWAIIAVILSSILMIYPYLRYIFTGLILADNPDMPAKEILKTSKNMMQGNYIALFIFILSFTGWYILSILTLGLGLILLAPYCYMGIVVYYDKLKDSPQQSHINDHTLDHSPYL